jgi:diphosphoinositol-polyphosphate diphosphatase
MDAAADCKERDMTSRQGRENQRYVHNEATGKEARLVIGTVPYRMDSNGNDGGSSDSCSNNSNSSSSSSTTMQILLINSRKHPEEWVLPKGGFEQDESPLQCAQRETWEEAGVVGNVGDLLVENAEVTGGKSFHTYYAMEVGALKEEWPEMNERGRMFFPASDARQLLLAQDRRKDRAAQLAAVDKLLLP